MPHQEWVSPLPRLLQWVVFSEVNSEFFGAENIEVRAIEGEEPARFAVDEVVTAIVEKVFVADISKAKEKFDWTPAVSKQEGLLRMIEWVKSDV